MKNFLWDSKSKSIRGSFVNLLITNVILVLIIIGCLNETVCKNLKELSTLIIGFFTVSFGVWKVVGVIDKENKS